MQYEPIFHPRPRRLRTRKSLQILLPARSAHSRESAQGSAKYTLRSELFPIRGGKNVDEFPYELF